MAPTMLTDAVLESILWSKVPISLQQEVKELAVGNVQALLQKLLCAESVVQDRGRRLIKEQRGSASAPRRLGNRGTELRDSAPSKTGSEPQSDSAKKSDTKRLETNAEMGQKKMKCF